MKERPYWLGKRVLVTGGAGFIGSHLVGQLVSAGALVTVLDNLSTGRRENLIAPEGCIDFRTQDISEIQWEQIFSEQEYDFTFHLAANAYVPPSVERPAWDYELNLKSSFRLLETLRVVKWPGILIYASSAAVYGNPVRIPIQEDDLAVPISPYGVAKLAVERYVNVYSQLYGLRAASLRLFSVYGPRQRKQVIYDLIDKLLQSPSDLFIYGDGTQVRDFNFVEDTARAALSVAEHAPLRGEVYNVASGRQCTIHELAEMICRIVNVYPKFAYSGSVRSGDPEKWSVDISRLSALGYIPQVSLDDGLRRTVRWAARQPRHLDAVKLLNFQ